MGEKIDFFADDPGRYQRFEPEFKAQHVIENALDEIVDRHSNALKLRDGEERDLSRLVSGLCFGKAYKTFQAIIRLCALGLGEDAAVLLRSNINLLINIFFIIKDNNPVERAEEFIDYSVNERIKYFDNAHDGKQPEWLKRIDIDQRKKIKRLAKKWRDVSIKDRAEKIGGSLYLFHYRQGYQLYSSLEHSDVMALSGYLHDENDNETIINSAPSDHYIDVVLAHNFAVMADLLVAAINYFNIQGREIVEKLNLAWKALDRTMEDSPRRRDL